MQPIHQLLSRIRWDPQFSQSRFRIGYWDRVEGKVVEVGLEEVAWNAANPSLFDIVDEEGIRHSIPFHRVRRVWRNGVLIWNRDRFRQITGPRR